MPVSTSPARSRARPARSPGAAFVDRGSFTVGFKGPQDYLTEVDGEVERLIATRLHGLFPEDGFIGEEGEGRVGRDGRADLGRRSDRRHRRISRAATPHFCVSIAAVVGREIEIGVIYDPMVDELFAARRGAGATLNAARDERVGHDGPDEIAPSRSAGTCATAPTGSSG